MPDYKRKTFKRTSKRKKNHSNYDNTITMTNKKQNNVGIVPEDDIKVVRGKKYKRKQSYGFRCCFAGCT